MNEIADQEGYTKQYLPTAQKTLKDHGGVYVAAEPGTHVDGSLPKGRVVILRWESMEALNGWRHSPEYEAIRKVGEGFAKGSARSPPYPHPVEPGTAARRALRRFGRWRSKPPAGAAGRDSSREGQRDECLAHRALRFAVMRRT